jgi:predicted small metal-binding protein
MKRLKCRIVEDHKSCRFEAVGDTEDEAKSKMDKHVTKEHKTNKKPSKD